MAFSTVNTARSEIAYTLIRSVRLSVKACIFNRVLSVTLVALDTSKYNFNQSVQGFFPLNIKSHDLI